jgi:hypothetical protein
VIRAKVKAPSGDQSDLERELIALRAEIVRAFENVDGPPPVTQMVARLCDDNPLADFAKVRREQSHHTHWSRVTPEEIEHFHDIWLWIGDISFQFYIPAYMVHALDGFIAQNVVVVRQPDWMNSGWDEPRNASALTAPQKACFLKFLKRISESRDDFTPEAYEKWARVLR